MQHRFRRESAMRETVALALSCTVHIHPTGIYRTFIYSFLGPSVQSCAQPSPCVLLDALQSTRSFALRLALCVASG